jgi:hypothetical protein
VRNKECQSLPKKAVKVITKLTDLPKRSPNFLSQQLGSLTVVSFNRSEKTADNDRNTYWNVECTCSTTEVLTSRQLKKHRKCRRCTHVDEILATFKPRQQQQFKLVAFNGYRLKKKKPSNPTSSLGEYTWKCLCNCGQTFILRGGRMKSTLTCPDCSLKRVSASTIGRRKPLTEKKYLPSAKILAAVKRAYAFRGSANQKKKAGLTLRQIAKKPTWSVAAIKELTTDLGLALTVHSKPHRLWEPAELKLVSEKRAAALTPLNAILRKKGFTRSKTEIRDKIIELKHLEPPDKYPTCQVAQLLGTTTARIEKLVSSGKLDTTPNGSSASFTRATLRTFLLKHPDSYALPHVDRIFFSMLVLKNSFPEQVTNHEPI